MSYCVVNEFHAEVTTTSRLRLDYDSTALRPFGHTYEEKLTCIFKQPSNGPR